MKRIVLAGIAVCLTMASIAQEKTDTIKVGGMIIIKKAGDSTTKRNRDVIIRNGRPRIFRHSSNVSTNWWIVDLGFANWTDNSNYTAAQTQGFLGTGVGSDQMKLRTGKSVNVNIWVFMQRLNLISHVVNLKYGAGVELNNYRFENNTLLFQKDPTKIVLNTPSANSPAITKNKLAADYLTVPLMLNFNFTPGHEHGFGFSAGVSGGYLYSSREKMKNSDGKVSKNHSDFDLEKWKLSYIGELTLGPIRLYGSIATKNMWSKGLDQMPYTVGIRLSNF